MGLHAIMLPGSNYLKGVRKCSELKITKGMIWVNIHLSVGGIITHEHELGHK